MIFITSITTIITITVTIPTIGIKNGKKKEKIDKKKQIFWEFSC